MKVKVVRFFKIFLFLGHYSVAGLVGYVEHPRLSRFSQDLKKLFQKRFGEDFIELKYRAHLSVIMLDFDDQGKNIHLPDPRQSVRETLEKLFFDLSQRIFVFDLAQEFQGGELVFFKNPHREHSPERVGAGVPAEGEWAWVIFRLAPSQNLKNVHEALKQELREQKIVRKTSSGLEYKDFPYHALLSVGLLRLREESNIELTLTEVVSDAHLPDPRIEHLGQSFLIENLILAFGMEKVFFPLNQER